MKNKVTMGDLNTLWTEIEKGQKDKTRTLKDVESSKIRNILASGAETAIKTGMATSIAAGTAGVAVGTASAIGGATVSGLGFAAGGTALGAAGAGAAAGSTIPIVGTVIGAGVGLAAGLLVGNSKKKKDDREKRRLLQEVISKQNTIIRDLREEVDKLRKMYGKAAEQNERYKYIISILIANDDLKRVLS